MTRLSVSLIAVLSLVAGSPPAALAQAVTRPTVTALAGVLRATRGYDGFGDTSGGFATVTALSVGLGGEVPFLRRGALTASAGARLSAASYGLDLGDGATFGGDLRLQAFDVYGRLGTDRASARLGVSLDLGRGLYDQAESFNVSSDGQHALVGQLRGEVPAGPVLLFARADVSLTTADELQVLVNSVEDPVGTLVDVAVDTGDIYGVQVGASVPAGPVVLGLAVFTAGRTEGRLEYPDGVLERYGFPAVQPVQYGYGRAFGVIPSVEYRAPRGGLTVRAEGSFSDFYAMENVPVGITLAGENGAVTRPALTVSVGVGL